jgi:hypothetical protein
MQHKKSLPNKCNLVLMIEEVLPTNIVNDENGDLLAYSHHILNRWKKQFCQLLNAHGITDVRQR